MLQGLGGRALSFAGGIAEGEDDGAFAVVGHSANSLWCEVARLTGRADKDRGPNSPDQLLSRIRRRSGQAEGGEIFFAQRDLALVLFHVGPSFPNQATGVDRSEEHTS